MGRLLVLILLFAGGSFRSGIYGVLSALPSFPSKRVHHHLPSVKPFPTQKVASKAAAKGYFCGDWSTSRSGDASYGLMIVG